MDKWQYLKLALNHGCYRRIAWIISAFTVVQEAPEAYKQDPYPYRLVQSPTGYRYISPNDPSELVAITATDYTPGTPLFNFSETVAVDESWCISAKQPVTTRLGNLLVNLICLVEAFGDKYPFVTGKIKVSDIESTLSKTLTDTPMPGTSRRTDVFYVDEMLKFAKHLSFLEALSPLCVYSATPKNIIAAPGVFEYKAQLLELYKGRLNDPLVLAEFEKKLKEYDEQWLKDDPSNGVLISGQKVKDIARKNMYLTLGAQMGFEDNQEATTVINCLSEGLPTDKNEYSALINNARSASFARAKETVKGGVTGKVLLRAVGNFTITDDDCGTQRGLPRTFGKDDLSQLAGRQVWLNNAWKQIELADDTRPYVDRPLIVRSPMYCKSAKDTVCKHCMGQRLSQNPRGLSNAATEISTIILKASLKARHGTVLATLQYDPNKQLT
jgi:hypothetical protein